MRNFIKTILKAFISVIIIFLIPFIPAIFTKILINLKIFENLENVKSTLEIFNNFYFLSYIGIGVVLLLWYFHKWETLKEYLKGIQFNLKRNGNEISARYIEETDKKKKFVENMSTDLSDNIMKNNMKSVLENKKIGNDNLNLKNENSDLRFFAAYNIINADVKSLLHIIYNEKFIEMDKFKSKIIQGFKSRNKNNIKMNRKTMNKYAKNKYDTIYKGLKFLNIIEPSEDDKEIRLTKEGKEFVKKYIEKEVGKC